LASLLNSKTAVLILMDDPVFDLMTSAKQKQEVTKFKNIVEESTFWNDLVYLKNLLEYPSNIIGKFERDDSDLSIQFQYFNQLKTWSSEMGSHTLSGEDNFVNEMALKEIVDGNFIFFFNLTLLP
jgi:hypothetical protein